MILNPAHFRTSNERRTEPCRTCGCPKTRHVRSRLKDGTFRYRGCHDTRCKCDRYEAPE